MLDRPKLWKAVQEAWVPPPKRMVGRPGSRAYRVSRILGVSTKATQFAGLDRPQEREAFFARLAQMRKAK